MEITTLLDEIAAYCGQNEIAESTFGRLAINDGKLMSRLRTGGRVTEQTCTRIRTFMRDNPQPLRKRTPRAEPEAWSAARPLVPWLNPDAEKSFRLYDNRQKYLLFVTTSSEKWMVAERAAQELANIRPHPPAVRLFDAGVGDGSVLARLMRAMHHRFPTMPFYIVGKEISVENLRLTLEKMPDRFCEHPATVLVMTNMFYSEAPWLQSRASDASAPIVWHELALNGTTGHEFEDQITDLQPLLAANWQAHADAKTGGPVYERPVVLVIYRKDYRFLLESVLPRKGAAKADFDFVLASQPYRARATVEFKAHSVIAPLVRALGPGGRLLGIHSHGDGPGLEIVRRIWPDEKPFDTNRHQLLREVKTALGPSARNFGFQASSDAHSRFRYEMYTLPSEIGPNIGTSTLLAAWNAAVYVAQIEDDRLESVISHQDYLDATAEVLRRHGGLWFWDETYVISRREEQD